VATYYDTADQRLSRAGGFLCHDGGSWSAQLFDTPVVSRPGRAGRPPAELRWLVSSLTRGEPLRAAGSTLEAGDGDLTAAGPRPGPGAPATEALLWATRKHIQRIVSHDPLLRLGLDSPQGRSPLHQMRVGCRRLRSALRAYAPLLSKSWVTGTRAELGWLAGSLGPARDLEVMCARLGQTSQRDPLAPIDPAPVSAMSTQLHVQLETELAGAQKQLRTQRYLDLLDRLALATHELPVNGKARDPLPPRPPKKLRKLLSALTLDAPDELWHRARIEVKRARYVAQTAGAPKEQVKALAQLQELLGEHQDAAIAAEVWLSFAGDPALALAAGQLYERERSIVRQARAEFLALEPAERHE
jgi:CHAD domain-containing protein